MSSIKMLQSSGLAHLIDKIKDFVLNTIQKEYNHEVIERNAVLTDKVNYSLYVNQVQCLLNGTSLRVMSLSDIDTRVFTDTRRFVWTKTAEQTDCYANIFSASSTAGRGVLKLTIHNTNTDTTETHYFCFIEDTPDNGAFLFCTSCEWDMLTRYNSSAHRLCAYLHVPDNFVGTITIEAERFNIRSSGLNWYITQPTSDTDNTYQTVAYIINLSSGKLYTDAAEYQVNFFHTLNDTALSTAQFRQPFGKYQVDLIYDFGTITVGDKIPDSVVNDVLLHHITKRLNSIESLLGGQNIAALSTQVDSNKTDIRALQTDTSRMAEDIDQGDYNLGVRIDGTEERLDSTEERLDSAEKRLQKLELKTAIKAETSGSTTANNTTNNA